ncbi:MAG: hypothetical protein PHV30_03100 [Candidatus Margulisbacteria bacterium]|nr:hypothetical protein [Candidatus Margulisiibacteriota bacterium]
MLNKIIANAQGVDLVAINLLMQVPGMDALKKIKAAQEAGKIGPVFMNDLLYVGLTAIERDQYFSALLSTWIYLDGGSQITVYDVMHPGALEKANSAGDFINPLRQKLESLVRATGVTVAYETYPWRTREYEMYVIGLICDCNRGEFNDNEVIRLDLRNFSAQESARIQYLLALAVREKIAKLGVFDMPTGY